MLDPTREVLETESGFECLVDVLTSLVDESGPVGGGGEAGADVADGNEDYDRILSSGCSTAGTCQRKVWMRGDGTHEGSIREGQLR